MLPAIRKNSPAHAFLLFCVFLAILMLLLTPFWALEWYRSPFPGFLLEPNNVVSQINGASWPGRASGVAWSDRLVEVNHTPVFTSQEAMEQFRAAGFGQVPLRFIRRDGSTYELIVLPIHVPFIDLFSLFIVPYLVGVTLLVIGLWAYRIRPDLRPTRAFVIFQAAACILTTTFLDMNTTHHVALLWSLCLPVGAAAFGYLALVFPLEVKIFHHNRLLRTIPWIIAILLGLRMVRDILAPASPYDYMDSWRWGYILNALGILIFIASLLARMLGNSTAVVRQQSRLIVFGAVLAFLPILFLYLIPIGFGGRIPEFRPEVLFPPLIFLPVSVTYAILRYRLLDVDRWLSRALTYMLTTGVALAAFYAILEAISLFLSRAIRSDNPLVMAAYLLALVTAFNPLRDLIQRGIDRLFYRSRADYRRAISSLSRALIITPNLGQTLDTITSSLGSALSPEKILLFLYQDEHKHYSLVTRGGQDTLTFGLDAPLPRMLAEKSLPLWFPTESPLPPGLKTSDLLTCEVFVPILNEGSMIGFLAVGRRLSGEPYSSDDLDFLSVVASQSSLALENARLFENLRHTLDTTREMKNLMDNIFASIATGVITTDLDQKITLFNRAAEEILDTPLEKALGQPLRQALPALNPALEQVAASVITRGEPSQGREISSRSTGEENLVLRLSAAPLRDAYSSTKGAALVFENLTETRKLEAETELIRRTFGRVVAPRVRDRLLADAGNLQLHGTRQTVTMLFADLSAFTSFSEKNSPETVFTLLNSYLDIAAQVILENEGTLDKFMGDAVMAMWNAPDPQPDHAARACRAALEILRRSDEARLSLPPALAGPDHRLTFRIGITTGPAIVGNVGTSQLFNYTAIGDTVNLAQRLQSSAKPGQIYLQNTTYKIVSGQFSAEPLPPLTVKGREHPVEVYLLNGDR